MNKLGSSSEQSSAADDETATFQNWVAAPPPVDVVAVESAHERLLNQYLAAWSEAVLIESWKPDQAHPRNEYLGPIARVLGTVLGLFMSIRSIVDSGIASDKQEGAAHVRSFVQRYVGGHFSRRLRLLKDIYLQLSHTPGMDGAAVIRVETMGKACEDLMATFPSWSTSARSVIPVVGLLLALLGALVATEDLSNVFVVVFLGFSYIWIMALVSVFESFRLKRELLLPGVRARERVTSPPRPGERNVYWAESELFRILGRPAPKELALDWLVYYALAGILPITVLVIFTPRNVPAAEDLEKDPFRLSYYFQSTAIVPALSIVVLFALWVLIRRAQRKRYWR